MKHPVDYVDTVGQS